MRNILEETRETTKKKEARYKQLEADVKYKEGELANEIIQREKVKIIISYWLRG